MTPQKLFGTDGVRGVAGVFLTPELALSLGRAAARVLGASGSGSDPTSTFVIGRDTRLSGSMLEAALAAGLLAEGGNILLAGVVPTPAVALLVTQMGLAAGVVISASHNPAADNGIKFFGPDGGKLSDASEENIESLLHSGAAGPNSGRSSEQRMLEDAGSGAAGPNSGRLGELRTLEDAGSSYVTHALASLEGRRLDGLKVVLDCANGAASWTGPAAFRQTGAEVTVINDTPDGLNINAGCGSTYPAVVAAEVVRTGADLGLAFDGDADRIIAVDEAGRVVDGDNMIAALALELKEQGLLHDDLVVSTVMANLGFRMAMASHGIELVETPVGDRYVREAMLARGASIGGEQSGHIIFSEFSTTGDGLITALRLAGRMVSTGSKVSELAAAVEKFPQVLLNVGVENPGGLERSERILAEIQNAKDRLGDTGRVLVRASGTEPLVRVMVEAKEQDIADGTARALADLIVQELLP